MALRSFRKAKPYLSLALAGIPVFCPLYAQAQLLTGFDDQAAQSAPASTQSAAPAPEAPQETVPEQASLTGFADEPPEQPAAETPAPDKPAAKSPKTGQVMSGKKKSSDNQVLKPSDEPVSLDAENMFKDDQAQTLTATGNVFLEQAGRILRADRIVYHMDTDTAIATGHVVLNEENGDIHYSEKAKLNDKLKTGFVQQVKIYLADGSYITADNAQREGGTKSVMRNAVYTACEPCKTDPTKPPLWDIRAKEVVHDETTHTINYKDATFEADGVPVGWLPVFSNADGSVQQKSGFIEPTAGYKSENGAFLSSHYYYGISPDQDATVGMMVMSKQDPLLSADYRQRWDNASLDIAGGITYAGRIEDVDGIDIDKNDSVRGDIIGNALWDMSDTWRSGMNLEWASDDEYMRQYNFSSDDVLTNQVYAERFSGRDYTSIRFLTFQDVRVLQDKIDQPAVLPEIDSEWTGEPDSVPILGGRWNFTTSALGLQRSGDQQDMYRLSLNGGWQKRMVSDYGFLTVASANIREDLYDTQNNDDPSAGELGQDVTAARFFPQFNVETSYPMEKPMTNVQATIEPVVELTVAPNINVDKNIPDEDSQDVEIDASNIFDPDRFPGYDRVEDESHVTYGMRTGLYGYGGDHGDFFLGQSYRLEDQDSPFPSGSGLDRRASDIVGQMSALIGSTYDLTYNFRLASNNLSSERQSIDANANWNKFSLSAHYLFDTSLEGVQLPGTDIDTSREQVSGTAGYYFNKEWRLRVGATEDLGADQGLRRAHVALDFFGQCLSWSLIAERNLVDPATGESSTQVTFNIGLKNLGPYKATTFKDEDADEVPMMQ